MKGANMFPEFAHMSSERFDSKFHDTSELPSAKSVVREVDSLESVIFAPNPRTGVPTSDIAYQMSQDCNPVVAEYIKRNLMREILPTDVSVDDVDAALDYTFKQGESISSYADRIRQSLQSFLNTENESKK